MNLSTPWPETWLQQEGCMRGVGWVLQKPEDEIQNTYASLFCFIINHFHLLGKLIFML